MGYTGSHGTFAQAETFDEAQANTATGVMSLDYNKLEQVASRVRDYLSVSYGSLFSKVFRRNLSRLDTNYLDESRFSWYAQILFTNVTKVYRASNAAKIDGGRIYK
jgi:hypothetical protein